MPKGKRSGVKQRDLKKSGSAKKRKAFKGIPKQKKKAENVAKRRRVEITFVGEDDVVSEQIPEPLASVSLRKLQESDDEADLMRVFLLKCQLHRGIGLYTWKAFESF